MTLKEKIAILQAGLDGKTIQTRNKPGGSLTTDGIFLKGSYPNWTEVPLHEPGSFNFALYDYRIKPEPREFYMNIYEDGTQGEPRKTRELAERLCKRTRGRFDTVRFVEVIED
jgi:hypothetical protein